MLPSLPVIATLILLRSPPSASQQAQVPFYNHPQSEVPLLNRIQIADYQGNNNVSSIEAEHVYAGTKVRRE